MRYFQELSWAVYMLIIFARDRVSSNCFSFKASLRSWKQGFVSLIGWFFISFCSSVFFYKELFVIRCPYWITCSLFSWYRFTIRKWTKQIFSYWTFTTCKFKKNYFQKKEFKDFVLLNRKVKKKYMKNFVHKYQFY